MAESAIAGTAETRPAATNSTGTDTTVRRLVSSASGDTYAAPKTADELIEALYKGYVFATREQLLRFLDEGVFQIWQAKNIYALVEIVDTSYGRTLNVLTVVGSKEDWNVGIEALEHIARANDADMIYSVGHLGWEKSMKQHGYTTERVLRMKKVLT